MKKIALILLFTFTISFSYEKDIADAIRHVSNESGVDARIYYSIIDIESGFNPYSLGMIANENLNKKMMKLPKDKFLVKSTPYNNRYLISVFSDSEENIIELAKILYDFDLNIDLGLMQISKQHLSKEELDLIFKPKYNIIRGNNVLVDCAKRYKVLSHSIECYNKGFKDKKSLSYYKKFANSFIINFGDDR